MQYKVIPVTSFHQNCSLVWCENTHEAALIDPGGEVNQLCQQISSLSLIVKKILLTHGHIDHVGGAKELAKRYRVPIIGPHCSEELLLKNMEIQCSMLNFEIIPPVIPDVWLVDHEVIKIGNFQLDVLHCPGHTPGHVVFWNKEFKFIFMGDVLFRGAIGRTDLPGGNIMNLMQSLRKLIFLGDDIYFLPGHGSISNIGYERRYNIFLKDLK